MLQTHDRMLDERLTAVAKSYIGHRQADLIAEAAANRSVTRPTVRGQRRFTGLRLHLGTLLIVVGRTLHEDDGRCPDPIHS
ncbi:MAG TPA: hypothetical protein VGE81_08570 [Candidatus Limnocylindrales bacterium]|jgi:hypothetical protein